jgi:hypothetical protein
MVCPFVAMGATVQIYGSRAGRDVRLRTAWNSRACYRLSRFFTELYRGFTALAAARQDTSRVAITPIERRPA